MRRIIKFRETEETYTLVEEEKIIFEIDKISLQFDCKKFYEALFKGDLDYSDIVIENDLQSDRIASRIFKTVNQLMSDIVAKLIKEIS